MSKMSNASDPKDQTSTAVFAAGCFWCIEADFEKLDGVTEVVSGYTGGQTPNPTYETVSAGNTGHREAVKMTYNPRQISYSQLLEAFWRSIDPFDGQGQFCDKGPQYTTAIYYQDEDQRQQAEQSLAEKQTRFEAPIMTEIIPAAPFYPAEDYHQAFSHKNPARYQAYRVSCDRDRYLHNIWDKKQSG
ncbi:MAG: peptide-methionine (S)-S-oxide reductase MsrA [Pseudomonadota bacterium]